MASDSASALEYAALNGDQVRFIQIKQCAGGDGIECTIHHISLAQHPDFIALSYVWGDTTKRKRIRVNNVDFNVTPNLYFALRRILDLPNRDPDAWSDIGDRFIWIDAICINQSDKIEKAAQVPRMGEIYSSAAMVIGWLGENDSVVEEFCLPSIFALAIELSHQGTSGSTNPDDFFDGAMQDPIALRPSFQASFAKTNVDAEDMTLALGYLFGRPWFSRVWIVQEVILAGDRLYLMAGDHLIPQWDLQFFVLVWDSSARLTAHYDFYNSVALGYQDLYRVGDLFKESTEIADLKGLGQYLQKLLKLTIAYRATLPHDIIYGKLGLCPKITLPAHLLPNYDLPHPEVFCRITVLCIESTHTLEVLLTPEDAFPDMPSWVPNLCSRMVYHPKAELAKSDAIMVSKDRKQLRVEGIRLGVIRFISRRSVDLMNGGSTSTISDTTRAFHHGFARAMSDRVSLRTEELVQKLWTPLWAGDLMVDNRTEEQTVHAVNQCYKDFLDGVESSLEHGYTRIGLSTILMEREAFVTDDDSPGFSKRPNSYLEPEDLVCALKGMPTTVILRPQQNGHLFLGPCELGGRHLGRDWNEVAFRGQLKTWTLI